MFDGRLRRALAVTATAALASIALPFVGGIAPAAAATGPVVTLESGIAGCNGVRTTPGSENTTKRLVAGNLEPGGSVTFEINFPVNAADVGGDFAITDCVFINDTAVQKYSVSFVPNNTAFLLTFTLTIPANAPIGAEYCNYAKTTQSPSASQASNRKANPACFHVGGDLRIIKIATGDATHTPLAGASFTVQCTTNVTIPPVVISGLGSSATYSNGMYSASGVAANGVIAIAGPAATPCTVTETAAPPGYDLPSPSTFSYTIPLGSSQDIQYISDPLSKATTSIATSATGGTVGTAITDTATLTGVTADATGTITFSLYGPVATNTPTCTGTAIFTTSRTVTPGVTSYQSTSFTPTLPGYYFWVASYSGDSKNLPSAGSCGAIGETSHLVQAQPGVTTQIDLTGAEPGTLGLTTLGDTATLSGAVGNTDGETVTFNLYGPYADGVTPDCATSLFTTTGLLSGGIAVASATYTPTAIGTYVWTATYPGDVSNLSVTDACNQATEKVRIVGALIDVTKSANPVGPVSSGDTIGFDITVSNTPAATATNVVITDVLPAGGNLNWSLSPSFTNCAITGTVGSQTLTCTFPTVAKGASVGPIHVESATTPADCGTVTNTASFTSNNAGQGSDGASVIVQCANVSLTKTADNPTVNAGEQIGYTVTAHNAGPGIARNVVVSDPLPNGSGVTWTLAPGAPSNCSITGLAPTQVLTCTAVDLASGATETVHVISATAFASCGTYDNTATLTVSNSGAPNPAHATTVVRCSSVTLTKTADQATVGAGTQIGFVVTAANGGPGIARDVTISDPLPAGTGTGAVHWVLAAGAPTNCSISQATPTSPQVLTCTAVDLASGGSEQVHVIAATAFANCGTYDNTATLTVSNAPAPNPAQAAIAVQCPALTLTKTADSPTPVDAGGQIGFTVTVTNSSAAGTGTAHNVVITDPLPAGTGVSWSLASGSSNCSVTGTAPNQVLSCTTVDLAPGASVTAHVVSATAFASCKSYPNVASLTAADAPSLEASASTTVQCPALTVVKTADAPTVRAGSPIGFAILVTNLGPGAATTATVNDPLPGGPVGFAVTWVIDPAYTGAGTCAISGAAGSQVLHCDFGSLAASAFALVHVSAATQFANCASFANTATAGAANGSDATNSDTTVVQCPEVTLTKTPDALTVDAGTPIGFTITASNSAAAGTGTATGVEITDTPLPFGDGINWVVDPASPATCLITGTAPTQSLACGAVDLAPGEVESVHITSATDFMSCATYDNTALLTSSNGLVGVPVSARASTTVQCAALVLTKTADTATVSAGSTVGFTIHATNAGPGTADGARIEDPLPSGTDVTWTIDPAYAGPGTCAVNATATSQQLVCELGDLPAGADASVHITSPSTQLSCAVYRNVVTLLAGNAPTLTAEASTTVKCADTGGLVIVPPVIVPPVIVPPVIVPPVIVPPVSSGPLAFTGAGPVHIELLGAVALLILGGALLAAGSLTVRPRSR